MTIALASIFAGTVSLALSLPALFAGLVTVAGLALADRRHRRPAPAYRATVNPKACTATRAFLTPAG